MAFITKRGNVWYIYWTQNDQKHGKSLGTKSKALATEYLKKFEYQLSAKELGQVTDVRIDQLKDEYLAYSKATKTHSTYSRHDLPRINEFMAFLKQSGVQKASEITAKHIQDYQTRRLRAVSPSSVRHDLFAASGLLSFAVECGYIHRNVARNVKKVKANQNPRRFLSQEELEKVFEHAKHTPFWTLTATAYYAGCRNSELCFLEWTDFDFDSNVLTLRSKQGFTLKSHQCRSIPINSQLAEILEPHSRTRGWCFHDPNGKQWAQSRLSQAFKKYVVDPSGVPDFSLHTLRHSFASHLVMKGVSIYKVCQWLGHRSVNTTMIYAHLSPQDDAINVL